MVDTVGLLDLYFKLRVVTDGPIGLIFFGQTYGHGGYDKKLEMVG